MVGRKRCFDCVLAVSGVPDGADMEGLEFR